MTDEERQKLCAALRSPAFGLPPLASARKAADEIELLAGQLQSTLVLPGARRVK